MNVYELLGIDLDDPGQKLAADMMRSERAMLDSLIGERVRRGISQKEVGERMNITQSAVARIESGDRDPRLSTLRRYAAALDMRVTFDVKPAATLSHDARSVLEDTTRDWITSWEKSGRPHMPVA